MTAHERSRARSRLVGNAIARRNPRHIDSPPEDAPVTTATTQAIARALFPISVMVGVAILIKGYGDTGDGFSAGVILSLGAVIQVACFGIGIVERIPMLRYAPFAAYAGIVLALGIAFVPLLFGRPVFTHWPPAGDKAIHFGTLEIITAVGFDICVCLLVFGFVVGTMTLLARTAAVATNQQAPSAEPLVPVDEGKAVRP